MHLQLKIFQNQNMTFLNSSIAISSLVMYSIQLNLLENVFNKVIEHKDLNTQTWINIFANSW